MIVYTEMYGADADGNRGRLVTEYELEKSDEPYIVEQIKYQLEDLGEDEDYPEEMEITLICPHTEDDIQFTITVKDYL